MERSAVSLRLLSHKESISVLWHWFGWPVSWLVCRLYHGYGPCHRLQETNRLVRMIFHFNDEVTTTRVHWLPTFTYVEVHEYYKLTNAWVCKIVEPTWWLFGCISIISLWMDLFQHLSQKFSKLSCQTSLWRKERFLRAVFEKLSEKFNHYMHIA